MKNKIKDKNIEITFFANRSEINYINLKINLYQTVYIQP